MNGSSRYAPDVRRGTLIAAILASGSVFLNTSVVNVALPAIDHDLQAGFSGLQWIVDGYLLTLASLLILGGVFGDLFGRRRVMLVGIAGFGGTLVFCGLAPTEGWLITGCVLQGVAGALIVPGALALIRTVYSDEEERCGTIGRAMGVCVVFTMLGGAVAVVTTRSGADKDFAR